uniref:Nucleotide-diphospho-sugar transferase domain-containing protein n=1 Tax=Nymphaea colorata TaxID=210225 RepID=A0A5K1CZ34_9MAGN
MDNNTLIMTVINKPFAENNSVFDLFLQSFKTGEGTQQLIKHLLVVTVDHTAFNRCRQLHPHCYNLITEGEDFSGEQFYSTPDYVKLMWRRLLFVADVLGRGYNILFTVSTY